MTPLFDKEWLEVVAKLKENEKAAPGKDWGALSVQALNEMNIRYCSYDGIPTLINDFEAWWYANGEWTRINLVEAGHNAYVIGKPTFTKRFGKLPHLPSAAFTASR